MILYFANRQMEIIGQASTSLPENFTIIEDTKSEDIETGIATFEATISFTNENRLLLEEMTLAGNYLLRSNDGENEFYTIIENEIDTKDQSIYVYAEDAGLDLLNEVTGEYAATEAHDVEYYINRFTNNSGFEIGINEIDDSTTRKLSWDGESTVTERLVSVANAFGGFEVSYSFDIVGMEITHKYINIYAERGKDVGEVLRLNEDIDRIVTTKTVADLATAFICTGGTPDNKDKPITLNGYSYDDGDFYVDGKYLKSRKALEKWTRFQWEKLNPGYEGHIVKLYSYDTTSQKELCSHAITELKKICDINVNYEVDINKLPENIKIGDRINIVDDKGELYLSTRILRLETSVTEQTQVATLGEHLIKSSGISSKVEELATQFATLSKSAKQAELIATNAQTVANEAKTQAESVASEVGTITTLANEAKTSSENALNSANEAAEKANTAQSAVNVVVESVTGLQTTISNAQTAADNALLAAQTAEQKANEAKQSVGNAETLATEAKQSATNAQTTAESAIANANEAKETANTAKSQAELASTTAQNAKADAEQAQKDIDEWADNLETYKATVTSTYARKTELTETETTLKAQIEANANELSIVHSQVTSIDETANNAATQAQAAFYTLEQAQQEVTKAIALAEQAQAEADVARQAADNAQAEADIARQAADTAKSVANQAEADLIQAEKDLANLRESATATEAEIEEAELLVENARITATNAQAEANEANQVANNAQSLANTAITNATIAQNYANNAAQQVRNAQLAVENVNESAAAQAMQKANTAQSTATEAQNIANTAKDNATEAQNIASQAVANAETAQTKANEAEQKALQAQNDLATAKQNLANVTSRVGATEEEVEKAKQDVVKAQTAADEAKANATTAQSLANEAKTNAELAQTNATNAKNAADKAQTAADEAKQAAEKAKEDVENLVVRVETAETNITKNSEQIALSATKTELIQYINDIEIGGRNLFGINKDISFHNVNGLETIELSFDREINGFQIRVLENLEGETICRLSNLGFNGSENESYTFSALAYSNVENSIISIDICDRNNTEIVLGVEKEKVKLTAIPLNYYNAESGYNGFFDILLKGGTALTGGTILYFENVKIERGNKATDYTEAPEDVKQETQEELIEKTSQIITEAEGIVLESLKSYSQNSISKTVIGHEIYYLATAETSEVVIDESEDTLWRDSLPPLTSTNNNLWVYEKVIYSDDTFEYVEPYIFATYDSNLLISSIKHYHAASESEVEVGTDFIEARFNTTFPSVNLEKPYLWGYKLITYTNGSTAETEKKVIGRYYPSTLELNEELKSQLKVLANSITMSVSELQKGYEGSDGKLQEELSKITSHFDFTTNGFKIGKDVNGVPSQFQVIIDDNEFSMFSGETRILYFELSESGNAGVIPELSVTKKFELYGLPITDENDIISCGTI